jgi:hypothetical protein
MGAPGTNADGNRLPGTYFIFPIKSGEFVTHRRRHIGDGGGIETLPDSIKQRQIHKSSSI